jgi:hypothetical protein
MMYRQFKVQLTVIKLLLFSLATSFVSYGQELTEDEEIDNLLDEMFFNDKQLVDDLMNAIGDYDFLYSSVTYSSNTFFAGRSSGVDQFNVTPQVSYFSSSGFNAALTSVYFQEQDPHWDFVAVTAGYGNTIGKRKNIHYNLSYSRFFFSDGFDEFNNSIDVSIGLRNKERTFGIVGSASYLFGTEQSIQLSSRVYGNFAVKEGVGYALKFRPQLSFLAAEQAISLPPPPPMNGMPPPPPRTVEEFGLLNTQLSIPVSYTTSTWDVELGWNLNLPSPIEGEGDLDSTNFFSLSIGYLFDLTGN